MNRRGAASSLPEAASAAELAAACGRVRAATQALVEPLSEADAQVQSMPDASPAKWHLAHTTWFFETLVLEAHEPGFRAHHPAYRVLFNSYYQAVGAQHPRPQRGLVTRPGLAEVLAYRRAVDERLQAVLPTLPDAGRRLLALGLQHEQQHQELILTDLLHLLSCNPLAPAYRVLPQRPPVSPAALTWLNCEGGLVEVGHDGRGFAFDNEAPRHRRWLEPYALGSRLVTQGEWAAFVADGGYRDPRWWLSAGWDWLRTQHIEAPLYWRGDGGPGAGWQVFGLGGLEPLQPDVPVTQISLYEADAYAHWLSAQTGLALRLPTEAEWEHAVALHAGDAAIERGNLLDDQRWRAMPAAGTAGLQQAFGDAWEWTRSAYQPYPGYRPWSGAVGEYNGKFMANQYVLRGGSFATPRTHVRASYRNFFPAETRWQFAGLRLARDPG